MTVFPNSLMADNDSTEGAFGATTADSGADPFTGGNGPWSLGVQMSSNSSEGYIYLPKPAEDWKATAIYVALIDKSDDSAKAEDLAVVSRSHVFSGASAPSDYITRYLALTTSNSGSNSEKSFTADCVPTATNYLVAYINIDSTDTVLVGGYVKIICV